MIQYKGSEYSYSLFGLFAASSANADKAAASQADSLHLSPMQTAASPSFRSRPMMSPFVISRHGR